MTSAPDSSPEQLEELLEFIRDARGFDFTGYKRASLSRRIQKRMEDVGVRDFTDYRDLLETNADEFNGLFNTILINVTSFFREPAAWQYLQESVLPQLLEGVDPANEIRIWSAGCSSGEEAFSAAMVLSEMLGIEECLRRVKIYGTDVDEETLHVARTGVYSQKAVTPLPDGFREKYFEPIGSSYVFRPDLRRRVIFGRHDLTRDAPISRLHLLICRNTLMYFNVEAQHQMIDRFHFALLPGGCLFLGKSEMLLADGHRFGAVSVKHRVFQRRPGDAVPLPAPAHLELKIGEQSSDRGGARRRQLAERVVESYPSPVIALDADDHVLMMNGQARSVFGLASDDVGRSFSDLQVSYRPVELRSLVDRVKVERQVVHLDAVEYQRKGAEAAQYFDILVEPLIADETVVGTVVVFADVTPKADLEEELRTTRENLETTSAELQSSNEELETTNEELQSSVEELETTNEELQATNEELETTNEELQSSNEELETMNEEMRVRTAEMDESRAFLEGIIDSVSASIVVLDANLAVVAWSRVAQETWGLRPDEIVGRSFFSIDFGLPTGVLREPVDACMVTGKASGPIELQGVNRLGRGIRCRVTASPLGDRRADGVVLLIEGSDSSGRSPHHGN